MTHIGQGGMVDDWWQSTPGKIAEPPTLRWKSGGRKCGYLSGIRYLQLIFKSANC